MTTYPVRIVDQLPLILKGFRRARGLTQAQLAKRLGMTQKTVSAMECHAGRISVARLLRVLAVLGAELVLQDKVVRQRKPGEW